jgi:hypothetical protein
VGAALEVREGRREAVGDARGVGVRVGKQGVRGVKREKAATNEHLGYGPHGSDELDVKLPVKLK